MIFARRGKPRTRRNSQKPCPVRVLSGRKNRKSDQGNRQVAFRHSAAERPAGDVLGEQYFRPTEMRTSVPASLTYTLAMPILPSTSLAESRGLNLGDSCPDKIFSPIQFRLQNFWGISHDSQRSYTSVMARFRDR